MIVIQQEYFQWIFYVDISNFDVISIRKSKKH